ncbi:uncharacterized protein LOC134468776 [Engraulis encrasicolus]|uniref:uncharacterized protein LOC134468776 n=1 Tax=Engraulis encrasicolus TaxID=184585 RepID=UPI002FD527C5
MAGEVAILSCKEVIYEDPNCPSTTWIYYKDRNSGVEEVTKGKVQQSARSERLRLLPNCSLHISDVSPEDAGLYTCPLFEGQSVSCIVDTFGGCTPVGKKDDVCEEQDVCVRWVDESGAEQLNSDHVRVNRQSNCKVQLAVKPTALRPPLPHTWRCQLTARGKIQASIPYTVGTPVTQVPGGRSFGSGSGLGLPALIGIGLAAVAVILVIIMAMFLLRKKTKRGSSAGSGNGGQSHAGRTTDEEENRTGPSPGPDDVVYSTVNKSTVPVKTINDKNVGDVTYADVTHLKQTQKLLPSKVSEDSVTYAAVHTQRA